MTGISRIIIRSLKIPRPIVLSALLTVTLCLCFADLATVSDKIPIYFYSSETTINNFKSLKMELDRYLATFGNYEFQPFSDREAFEEHVKGKERCVLVLSSWHYQAIHKEFSLKPVLTGVRDGKKYQRSILIAKAEAPTIESVISGRIASASSSQHTMNVLRQMLKDKFVTGISNILTVPKDIDALMSVGFGMSKSAVTTANALEELRRANSALYQKVKVFAESEENLLLIIAVPEGFREAAEPIIEIFERMNSDTEGKAKAKMLGLDGWQELDTSEKVILETE